VWPSASARLRARVWVTVVDQQALTAALDDFAAVVTQSFSADDVLRKLAQSAVRVLPVDAAGVMVPQGAGGRGGQQGPDVLRFLYATTGEARELDRLQESLGEGPCRDSLSTGSVLNLADVAAEGWWPEYQLAAARVGLRAVSAIPLQARGQTWGVLDTYRRLPRRLDPVELTAARTLASLATSYLVVTADRDEARRAQEQLAHHAMHDPLTGLPVRWVFLEQLAHSLRHLARQPGHVGVLFLDLDGLKYVNDTYGHAAGDALIITCVERVRAAVRPTDVVARIGGDEFVVLLEQINGPDDAARIAQRVLHSIEAPYQRTHEPSHGRTHGPSLQPSGAALRPSASIGMAVTDDPEQAPDTLVAHADAAMYEAKHAGKGRLEVFDPDRYATARALALARTHLTGALRTALQHDQLALHYQPIIDLRDPRDHGEAEDARGRGRHGRRRRGAAQGVYAVEALARWQHPQRGLLSAGEFVPAAERSGLLPEIDVWVLSEACRQLAAWDAELGDRSPRRMFINISTGELSRPELPERVRAALAEHGLGPDRITLEVTETGLFTHPDLAEAAVSALRRLGCSLAIDDFGAGYSSLVRLEQVTADVLKVDGSFAGNLRSSATSAAVVSAVLLLGERLHRTVVIEGVEDAWTLRRLLELGATHVQGYHLHRPQGAAALAALLTASPPPTPR
jgi:diguanylate cyclase (GGDEF)-like protein